MTDDQKIRLVGQPGAARHLGLINWKWPEEPLIGTMPHDDERVHKCFNVTEGVDRHFPQLREKERRERRRDRFWEVVLVVLFLAFIIRVSGLL